MTETETHWWMDHDNLVLLTSWLAEEGTYTPKDVAFAVEKPWKYTDEFTHACHELQDENAGRPKEPRLGCSYCHERVGP